MKLALVVLLIICSFGCSNLIVKEDTSSLKIAVTVENETIEWRLMFGNEIAKSCYLQGDVRRGTSQNIETNEETSISYVRTGEALTIESPSGFCDAGVEVKLVKVNGVYEGDLYERSFFGHEKIGTVKEIIQ